jgi:hypothetical protein
VHSLEQDDRVDRGIDVVDDEGVFDNRPLGCDDRTQALLTVGLRGFICP